MSKTLENRFFHLASRSSALAGSAWAFALATLFVVVWLITGPLFGFSNSWQLVANTVTTLVTFLMVFLIQHAQNRETRAMQLKLDELVAAMEGASNRLIDAEELDSKPFDELGERFRHLASDARKLRPGVHVSIDDEAPASGDTQEIAEDDIVAEAGGGASRTHRLRPRRGDRPAS